MASVTPSGDVPATSTILYVSVSDKVVSFERGRRVQLPVAPSFIPIDSGQDRCTMNENETPDERTEPAPEDQPQEPGAEGGSSSTDSPAPFVPNEDDDSPLGDSDQHSDA
jgi:hypothetical protein